MRGPSADSVTGGVASIEEIMSLIPKFRTSDRVLTAVWLLITRLRRPVTLKEISNALQVGFPSVSRRTRDLTRQGLLSRYKEGRISRYDLTEDGRSRISQTLDSYGLDQRGILTAMDDEIMAVMNTILEPLDNLELNSESRIVFFLGAGASAPSGIPTVRGLLRDLWTRSRKLEKREISELEQWCAENGITNIEDLLTAAYISDFVVKNADILKLMDWFIYRREAEEEGVSLREKEAVGLFQDTLQTLFALLSGTMIEAKPNRIHELISDFAKKHKKPTIITTNYDGCMDEALTESTCKFSYIIDTKRVRRQVPLIKMHGSVNWFYCESCQSTATPSIKDVKKAYEGDLGYSVVGICNNCRAPRKPLIVPPLKFKYIIFPPLIELWDRAREEINEADVFIIIGYSFSDADDYISRLFIKAIGDDPKKYLVMLSRSRECMENLRKRLSVHIENFEQDRFIAIEGKAEETIEEVMIRISKATREGEKKSKDPKSKKDMKG